MAPSVAVESAFIYMMGAALKGSAAWPMRAEKVMAMTIIVGYLSWGLYP